MSSTSSVTSQYSNLMRVGGLASGIDTDSIIKSLMASERVPLDKVMQQKQLAEWKQDAYREMTTLLTGFQNDYFNVLKSSSNMLSKSAYKKYSTTTTDDSVVTITGGADSTAGSHKVTVYNLATADKAVSSAGVTDPLQGSAVTDYNLSGKKFKITLDGITREITLDNYTYTPADESDPASGDIVSKADTGLQALIDNAFGAGKITVNFDADAQKISFSSTGGASKITLASGSSDDALASLGFSSGASNRLSLDATLDTLKGTFANDLTFDADGNIKFTINSKSFTFNKSTTLSSMMNTINSDETAKVNMSYDETTDKFTITSKLLGDGDNIVISSEAGNFFGAGGATGINTGSAATEQGVDAKVKIDGQTLVRSSNSFAVNGVTYNILKPNDDPATESETVSLSLDTDAIYDTIKSFVDKYNDVIGKINDKIAEKYDRDYAPLTDTQKESMSDSDIEKWETKAKTGLLHNDDLLQNMIYKMRSALSNVVDGVTGNLSSIGITTGEYTEKGKLNIDENKLKSAISANPDMVMNLFCKAPSTSSNLDMTSEQRQAREKSEGLAYRLNDILNDYVRTKRDNDGKKGLLLEKAGLPGDASEYTSTLFNQIYDYNKEIVALTDKLSDKETYYYNKFTAMEQAINQMNSQSSYITSMLGSK